MAQKEKEIVLRVLFALFLVILPFNIFLFIFFKPTLYLSYFLLLALGYSVTVFGKDFFVVNDIAIRFISACIAPSAYYLITLLIILTKDIKLNKALKMFFLAIASILTFNVLRIVILIILLLNLGTNFFEAIHFFVWTTVSTLFVAVLWVFLVKYFKVKTIPVYSDFMWLWKKSKRKKPRR